MSGTPLRQQYLDIKRRHRDAILLFRIGDFYEAFDDDARLLAKELSIVLTSKLMGRSLRVPLAGIPHHSLERHLATLIGHGHRVAICEQLTATPVKGEAAGRGLIERDVVRVVTPGTIIEPGLLQSKVNNYLAALIISGRHAGIAYADVTTGEFAATEIDAAHALTELQRLAPSEVLIPRSLEIHEELLPGFITRFADDQFDPQIAKSVLLKHFGARSLAPFGLTRAPHATVAAGALVSYLRETQIAAAEQLTRLTSYHTGNFMQLDAQTIKSLELFDHFGGASSLLSMLDVTRTPMGGRGLRRWLRQPLLDKLEIERRHEHVSWFVAHERERAELFAALELTHDIERLLGRIRASMAMAQEVLALAQSLEMLPRVRAVLQKETQKFGAALAALPTCDGALRAIRAAISEELPKRAAVNGVIRTGYSEELDRLRELLRNGRSFLADMEQRERARTGIKSLRVGFNKVFGHYIEVTRPNLHLVPENYTRKQTLAAAERFITLELKEHESLVVNAQDRIAEMETSLFRQVCLEIGKSREEILAAAKTIAYLDAIASLADVAANFNYARPVISETPGLYIEEGRHPMLERAANIDEFVANDLALGGEAAPQIALITGPNMSGKSTYLRQTALIVLMAQAGSFVPASAARVGLCDRIFTRIGLYDRIGSGESTFMTEMTETAHILHHATARSLILLDELGRGTSTYDGLAVARAVLEYIHNHPHLRAQTLFATHYHELTELAELLPRLQNLHVEIAEQGSELVFLYKISAGVAEKSYGVYAAKLAGLPKPVVRRAAELLKAYEAGHQHNRQPHDAPPAANAKPPSTHGPSQLVRQLLELDPDALSPVEALMKLYEFRRLAEEDEEKSTDLRAKRTA